MSDLYKQTLKNKMASKPPLQQQNDDSNDEEEEMKDQFIAVPNDQFTNPQCPLIPSGHQQPIKAVHNLVDHSAPKPKKKLHDYSPLQWNEFYDEMEFMENGTPIYIAGKGNSPLYLFLHGAGQSAMSFACVAQGVKKFAMCVGFDFRGHGESKSTNCEVSTSNLIDDTFNVVKYLSTKFSESTIIIMGHSMGGSIATKATQQLLNSEYSERIQGLIVVDVVEGTAIDALPFMETIVNSRPKGFNTYEQAIQWSLTSSTLRNLNSARVSIPSQLVPVNDQEGKLVKLVWKVDLLATDKYWMGWFKGLTQAFLNIRIPKILMLAERERMDTDLTVAQMQGKFRLITLQNTGHSIQEDDPSNTIQTMYDFLSKFRVPTTMKEVELLKQIGIGKFHPLVKAYQK